MFLFKILFFRIVVFKIFLFFVYVLDFYKIHGILILNDEYIFRCVWLLF